MEKHNPFTPVFGRIPPYMAGRTRVLHDIRQAFDTTGSDPNLCTVFVGARGTGKTALLSLLAREASARGWVAANVSAEPGMLEDIVEQAERAAGEFVEVPGSARVTSVSLAGLLGAEWEYRDPASGNWRTRMTDLVAKLNEQGIGLLITVDEVKGNVEEMVQLASVYQHFVREERKVSLLMAGLPSHVSSLVSHDSVSFLRRAQTRKLGGISDADVQVALQRTVEGAGGSIDSRALENAVAAVGGFPYMLQLVGYHSWEAAPADKGISVDDVRDGAALAQADFESSVLDATYRELTDGDLAFLEAMLADGGTPSSLADISQRTGKSRANARAYKARLIEQGVIGEERRGYVRFELPGFREYLQAKLQCLA